MVFTPQKETRSRSPQPFGRFLSQLQDALKAEKQGSVQGRRFQGQSAVLPSCLSVALPLPDLDPLQALEQLGGFQVPHFYWEQPSAGLAIAAAHAAIQAKFQGPQRFSQAQAFVNQQQRRMVRVGDRQLPGAQPRFFCSFTFFDQVEATSPFPPATLLLPRWQVVRQGQANRHLHHRLPKDQAESSFVANFQLRQGQVNPQEAREAWEVYCQLQALPRRDRLRAVQRSRSQLRLRSIRLPMQLLTRLGAHRPDCNVNLTAKPLKLPWRRYWRRLIKAQAQIQAQVQVQAQNRSTRP